MDITYFPYDSQTCEIELASWGFQARRTVSIYPTFSPESTGKINVTEVNTAVTITGKIILIT
jgi:hypothetical protein